MRIFIYSTLLALGTRLTIAQDLLVKSDYCIEENIQFDYQFNHNSYAWDFCFNDFINEKNLVSISNINESTTPQRLVLIEDNNSYFGFLTSRNTNNLIRLDFGADLNNLNPSITDLGRLSDNILRRPDGITFTKENNEWIAFITRASTPYQVVRLSFGSDITSVPDRKSVV